MTPFYYGLGIGIIIGCNIGFVMAIALRELKRMSWEHYLMSPPPLTESQKKTLACNLKNSRQFNAEQKRKEFKIINN